MGTSHTYNLHTCTCKINLNAVVLSPVNTLHIRYQLYASSVSVAIHEDNEGSTLRLVTPLPQTKIHPSSSWCFCCCFRSSPRKTFFSPTPTARRSLRADNASLVQRRWYHGDISWQEAKKRLTAQDSDCCYLVRKSQHQPGNYVISVMYGGKVKHHTVLTIKYQYYEVEGTEKPFSSMDELIAYYQDHFLSTEEELLTIPCPRPTLTPHMKQPPQMEIPGMSIKCLGMVHCLL